MDLGKLLGALDGDEIKDALELVRENCGLLEQLGKGVGLIGDAADGIGKVPLMDSPAKRLAGAADELDSATDNVKDLAASMDTITDALATVGTALTKLGDHLAESGGEARGFLHS
jgi:hypothetical protein